MDPAGATLTIALALAAGVACQAIARRVRVPGVILLLGAGMGLGPDGLGWVLPDALGDDLLPLVRAAVAIILFEGGLNLRIDHLRRSHLVIRRLITLGAAITAAGAALAAWLLLDWAPRLALLFGSLVVVTGPTVVGPLVREMRLRPAVGSVLQAEGVLIDPIGALLAVLVLEVVLAPAMTTLASEALGLGGRLILGVLLGSAGGGLIAWILHREWVPEGLENVTTLAGVWLLFEGSEALLQHSGLLSVAIAGGVVGNLPARVDRELREFKDQITVLLIGLLFILLAAGVKLRDLGALGPAGLGVLALIIGVIRPLGTLASARGSDLTWRERLLVAAVAPRGIVAAAIASITAVALDDQGIAGGSELRALVFLVISGTVISAGVLGPLLAWLLDLRLPTRDTVAILGAQELGILLGRSLAQHGIPVIVLDSNARSCAQARQAGLNAVCGDALDQQVLESAGLERVGTAIAVTANETLNALFARRARLLFGVRNNYVALQPGGMTPEVAAQMEVKPLFEMAHDVERWNVRARRGDVSLEGFELQADARGRDATPANDENLLFLVLRRGKQALPMSPDLEPHPGDVAFVAIHRPEREDAHQALARWGWKRVEITEARDGMAV
jgi:NhaP-type Na+/H+ or K+/H+ antiporter